MDEHWRVLSKTSYNTVSAYILSVGGSGGNRTPNPVAVCVQLYCLSSTGSGRFEKVSIFVLSASSRTPLHIACASGHVDVVQFLVECKAKLNLCDNQNRSALMKVHNKYQLVVETSRFSPFFYLLKTQGWLNHT